MHYGDTKTAKNYSFFKFTAFYHINFWINTTISIQIIITYYNEKSQGSKYGPPLKNYLKSIEVTWSCDPPFN